MIQTLKGNRMIDEKCYNNQMRLCRDAGGVLPGQWEAMREMMLCESNPMTRSDLYALIKRRPDAYDTFRGIADNNANWNDDGTLKIKG
jgi:hypothetical protein